MDALKFGMFSIFKIMMTFLHGTEIWPFDLSVLTRYSEFEITFPIATLEFIFLIL